MPESEGIVRAKAAKWAILGAGCAALLALSPALSAVRGGQKILQQAKVSLRILGSIGSFTPVTRDERLARAYADAVRESQTRGFRFTPASGTTSGERTLTVLSRATSEENANKRPLPGLGVAPVAFSLGKNTDRIAGDNVPAGINDLKPIVENVQMPKTNFTLQPDRNRFSTNFQVEARDQTATGPTNSSSLGQEKSYSVDLSSSYSLTRHLDVQAGVRYRGPDNRLAAPLTDQAKDSQAVYVGTKLKF